jgi:type I restriction enzyme R subunit
MALDREDKNAIIKDRALLKQLFRTKMESKAPEYLGLLTSNFDDKDVDNLIEHFRDKDRRKGFFKEYKEIEMLYEIISPDAYLRPYLDAYSTLSAIYAVVCKAYTKTVYVDKAFQKKTNQLVQRHIGVAKLQPISGFVEIDEQTIELIK